MATESSHRLIMGKWFNYIFSIITEVMWSILGSYVHKMIVYPVYVFDDQWPFYLVAMATLNLKKKKIFFKWQFLQNHWSSWTLIGTNVAWHRTIQNCQKFGSLPLGLVAMATESSHRLIMGEWLNCTFSITIEVIWIIFGSYDHLMIVFAVYMFYDQWSCCLVATATFNFDKGRFQMTTWKPLGCLGKGNSE